MNPPLPPRPAGTTPEGLPTTFTPKQAELSLLVVNGIRDLHKDFRPFWGTLGLIAFAIGIGLVLGGFGFIVVHWVLGWVGGGPNWIYYLLGLFPVAVGIFFCKAVQYGFGDNIRYDTSTVGMIRLQRLEMTVGSTLIGLVFFLGVTLAAQTHVLMYTTNHCGIEIEGGRWECLSLSLDNLFHGIVLYASELYNWHLTDRVVHTSWSATVFLGYRLAFDGLVIFTIVALYRRQRITHLMTDAPPLLDAPTPQNLVKYLRDHCYRNARWGRTFTDEFVFLCMVEKYLSGKYEECRLLATMFADVNVPASVRELFVDPHGIPLIWRVNAKK